MQYLERMCAILISGSLAFYSTGCSDGPPIPSKLSSAHASVAISLIEKNALVVTDASGSVRRVDAFSREYSRDTPRWLISDADVAALRVCSTLESLDLLDTQVTSDGLAHLSAFPNLAEVTIYRQSDVGFRQVAKCRTLKTVYCSSCELFSDGLADFNRLNNLSTLGFIDTSWIASDAIANLPIIPSLKTLLLPDGDFRDSDLQAITKQPALERVEFRRSCITVEGLRSLCAMPSLKSVSLRSIQGDRDAVAKIRMEHQNVRIFVKRYSSDDVKYIK